MTTPEIMGSLKNPRYDSVSTNDIRLDAIFNGGEVTFLASERDTVEAGRYIHQKALAGDYGNVAPYSPPIDVPKKQVPKEQVQGGDIITKLQNEIIDLWKEIEEIKKRLP